MDVLRSYRFQLGYPQLNSSSKGIAIFDTVLTFLCVFLLDRTLHISKYFSSKKQMYLLVIPLGIVIHHIVACISFSCAQITFLNKKIFSNDLNIYHIILVLLLGLSFLEKK